MNRRQLNIIKDLARQAREWAEENAKKHFPSDLSEFCGIASANLHWSGWVFGITLFQTFFGRWVQNSGCVPLMNS